MDKCKELDNCEWISYKDNGACYLYEKCTVDPLAVDFQTTQIDCSSTGMLAYYIIMKIHIWQLTFWYDV